MNRTLIHLDGFTADHALGLLAALGLLQTIRRQRPEWEARLGWRLAGFWRATLTTETPSVTLDDVVEVAWAGLEQSRPWIEGLTQGIDKNLNLNRATFRELIPAQISTEGGQILQCMLAEVPVDQDCVAQSSLQMLNGAGRQDFLPALLGIARRTTREHLEKTLQSRCWTYRDDARGGLSLRLDASGDRQHALLPAHPDDLPMTTELAANRLAIEAFTFFGVFPGMKSTTTGFHRIGRQTVLRWPVWTMPLVPDEIRPLLGLPELAETMPDRDRLRVIGIAQVFEAERRLIGKGKALMGPSRAMPV